MENKLPIKSEACIKDIEDKLLEEGLVYYIPTHIAFNTPLKLISILRLTISEFLSEIEPKYQLFKDLRFYENLFMYIGNREHTELLCIIPNTGKPLYRNFLSSKYQYLWKKGRIPQLNAHVLRYTFFYREYKRTGSMSYVQKNYFDPTNYSLKTLHHMLSVPMQNKKDSKVDKDELFTNIDVIINKLSQLKNELQSDTLSLQDQVTLFTYLNNILVELGNPAK